MFIKNIISNTYLIVFVFATIGYLSIVFNAKRYQKYILIITLCFFWRFFIPLQSERYSVLVSIPLIVFFTCLCMSHFNKRCTFISRTLFISTIIFFLVVLYYKPSDSKYILDASDFLSSYWSSHNSCVIIDHSNNNAKRLGFYSNTRIFDTKQILSSFDQNEIILKNEFLNYSKLTKYPLFSMIINEQNSFDIKSNQYKVHAHLFTNTKKIKALILFNNNNNPSLTFNDSFVIFQTNFDKWRKYGYKYHVTDTSLLRPITLIPFELTPTIGDGYYKNSFTIFEKKNFYNNSFLHLSSKRESGFFTENVLPFHSDLFFSSSIVSIDESKFNLIIYLFNHEQKFVSRELFLSFFLPPRTVFNNFNCLIPKNLYTEHPFAKIAFELEYGDILIDWIKISSL